MIHLVGNTPVNCGALRVSHGSTSSVVISDKLVNDFYLFQDSTIVVGVASVSIKFSQVSDDQ